MIISDRHKFIFVHIPKCGGTTIRNALMPFDEHKQDFFDRGVAPHPDLGTLDYHHLPLSILAEHFPETFALFSHYRSYALIRDPLARFLSAVNYRYTQKKGMPKTGMTEATVTAEVDEVIDRLIALEHAELLPPDMIYFTRQSDFVFLDGRRIVSETFGLDRLGDMIADISHRTQERIEIADSNVALSYQTRWLASLDARVQPVLQAILPRAVWKPVFTGVKGTFMSLGLIRRARTSDLADYLSRAQADFIAQYYEADARLFADTMPSPARQSPKSPEPGKSGSWISSH